MEELKCICAYVSPNITFLDDVWYSKVPPLRNCIIRHSGLILVKKIPVYKKLSRLIHVQFLLQRYIVIFYGIYLNMAPIRLRSHDAGRF